MTKKDYYIRLISLRGDHYGNDGGLHSLLIWCNKLNLQEVTELEAKTFYENPNAEHTALLEHH